MKGNEILLTTNPIFETTVILVNAMINCHKKYKWDGKDCTV